MRALRILVLTMGGGYFKAILLNGQETIYGRDLGELIGRLKLRPSVLPVPARNVAQALDIIRR